MSIVFGILIFLLLVLCIFQIFKIKRIITALALTNKVLNETRTALAELQTKVKRLSQNR